MDTESENMTPPSSPILGYSGPKDHHSLAVSGVVFCLSCKGQPKVGGLDRSFSQNGYILRMGLIKAVGVLSATDSFEMDRSPMLYSMFGRKWDPTDVFQLKKLVAVSRKNIASLEILADSVYSYNYNGCGLHNNNKNRDRGMQQHEGFLSDVEPWSLRKDVCLFLNFVVSRRNYFAKTLTHPQLKDLFGGLRKSLGKAESWSALLKSHCGYRDGNDCTSALYHTFHLQLELRWSLLVFYGADPLSVKWVLEDLIYLALFKYNLERDKNLCDKQPFNCWCVKEMWTMFRLLLEEMEKDFWKTYAQGMQTFISSRSSKPDAFFPIWLTVHIASLRDYDLSGTYSPERKREEKSNAYSFINDCLKEWVSRGGKSAEVMQLVYKFLHYWGFDLEVIILFWNNFIPKLDKNLEVGSSSLNQYESVDKWVKLIEGLNSENNENLTDMEGNPDYFLSFLRLLVGHARLCNPKDWKKLKSHIGMKLNRNNVGNFGEIGLVRVSTLYLTLAFFTDDTMSMSERLKEILEFGKGNAGRPGRKKTLLRAKAAMILLLLKKSQNISSVSITSSLMDTINAIMSQSPLDTPKKDMIMVYLDLLDSLPSPSTPDFYEQSLHRDDLISPNLTMWLTSCGLNYVTRTLRVLDKLTSWIISSKTSSLMSYSQERDDMASKISDRTLHFLNQSVILKANRTPSTDIEPLASVAANLTVLGKGNDAFAKNLDHFALNERTCPEVSQYYVSKLLSNASKMSLENSISDLKWCQVWMRLNALDCSVPDELNDKVLGTGFRSTSNEALLKRFCSTSDDWSRGDTQTILHPLVVLCKAAVGTILVDNPSSISSIIKACAIVLKHVTFEKVYVKGDQMSAAHKILETLVPAFVGTPPWEKLPQKVVQSLRNHLFDMFETVISYPSIAFDPYLQRKVQDIVTFAILGFVGDREQMDDDHPGIKIMTYSVTTTIEIVGTILNQTISNLCKSLKDPKLIPRFVQAVTGLKQKHLSSVVMKFLPGILTIFVYSPSPQISAACVEITIYACTFGLTPFKTVLLDAFKKALDADFGFKNRRFYELCTFLNKCSRQQVRTFLRVDLLPLLEDHVFICESKRAIGNDNALRQPLLKLKQEIELLDAQRS